MDPLCIQDIETVDLIAESQSASDSRRSLLEDQLVRRYLPMTRRLAHQYAGHGWDSDDLVQVANMALIKAIRRFNPERGAFESYAKATISGELKNHLRDHCWSIKPPRRIQELQSQIHKSTEILAQEDGTLPGTAELAQFIGAPVEAVSEAMTARSCHSPSSIDQPVGQAGRSLADSLCSDDEPYSEVDGHVALLQICTELSDDDRELIRLRFYECMSQREIADEIGVSQMQVSRRLASLISRLRTKAADAEVA